MTQQENLNCDKIRINNIDWLFFDLGYTHY